MISNISNDSPYLSSNRDNSSMIPDVLEQIKKKSEELSTSDASIKLLQNLTNPTNLTNPQIISTLNHNTNNNFPKINKLPLIKPNRLIFSNEYTKKMPKKSKSEIMTINLSPFSTIDPFNLNNYHKLIERAELEILFDKEKQKPRKRIFLEKINKNFLSRRNSLLSRNVNDENPLMILPENKSEISEKEDIWEKVKNTNLISINREKDIKTSFINFIPKKDYIEKTNLIKLLQFNNKNKNERYYNYLSMKNSQMKSTDDTMNKLQKSKDFLEKKYNDEYVSYLRFLGKELEKEKKKEIILKEQVDEILYEVNKLQKNIDKIKNHKKSLINWLYFQIQVKESLPQLPEYYESIIEDNLSLSEINKKGKGKYHLDLDEYLRIMNYRGKNIYDDANNFFKKLEDLEIRSLTILNNKLDSLEEDKMLKKELDELQKKYLLLYTDNNSKCKELNYHLRDAKTIYNELKNKLFSIKNIRDPNKKCTDINVFTKLISYSKLHCNNKLTNFILKKENKMVYYFALCLYHIISLCDFDEIKYNKLSINYFKDEDRTILDILDYAEKILNLLLAQKKYYYSDENLKKIYLKVKSEIDKKTKIEKIQIQIKLRKEKEIEKAEKLKEKINKHYYKPSRKIDFDYYRKEMNKKHQNVMNKSIKRETKFEDFFYDIYS